MIKAILMDWNGVVINDEGIQMRVYREVLKEDGIDLTEQDYLASLGMDDRTFVAAAYERVGSTCDEAKIDQMVAAKFAKWREQVSSDLPMFPGIRDFVEKMAQDFTLAIVSMASRREIDFVLDASGLRPSFTSIVSAEDVSRCKPDPECYKLGFRQIDAARTAAGEPPLTQSECIVIEDSPPGVMAARNADLRALGVANTVPADELRAAGASAVAKDLRDWMPESVKLVFA
jgi:beta-phosphoglucomutase